jgi:hypothetical protein
MCDFSPSPEMQPEPEAFQLADATNDGPFVRSRPGSPFSDAKERELASQLLQVTNSIKSSAIFSKKRAEASSSVGSKVTGPRKSSVAREGSRNDCL